MWKGYERTYNITSIPKLHLFGITTFVSDDEELLAETLELEEQKKAVTIFSPFSAQCEVTCI